LLSPLKERAASSSTSPEGLLAGGFPRNSERMIVYGALQYHLSLSGLLGQENLWWMEGGRMAKGLCPGVGRSCRKESVEKRGRERKRERRANIPRGMWKTNKALTQGFYLS